MAAMEKLLEEWDVLGRPVGEVEYVCGEPTERDDNALTYRFDSGLVSLSWVFSTENGVVRGVRTAGGD